MAVLEFSRMVPALPRAFLLRCAAAYTENRRKILALPEIGKHFEDIGTEVISNSPEEFAAVIKAEAPRWSKFIKEISVRLD